MYAKSQQNQQQPIENGNSQPQFKNNYDQKISSPPLQQQQQQQLMMKPQFQQSPQNPQNGQQNTLNGSNGANGNLNGSSRTQIIQTTASNTGKYKTSICRHYRNGNCQLGTTCHFAHGDVEMRNTSDPLPQNIPQQPKVVCNNFKTVKCRYFERGFCKNQNACCFAHGDQDLVPFPHGTTFAPSQPLVGGGIAPGHFKTQMMMQQQGKITDLILLISILQNLEQVFSNDQGIKQNLQYAQQIAKQGDQKGAFNIISDIMKDPKRTDEEKSLYNTIYTNAQMFYSQPQFLNQGLFQGYSTIPAQFVQSSQQDSIFYQQQIQFIPQQELKQQQPNNLQGVQQQQQQQQQYIINPQLQMQQQQQQVQNVQFQNQI